MFDKQECDACKKSKLILPKSHFYLYITRRVPMGYDIPTKEYVLCSSCYNLFGKHMLEVKNKSYIEARRRCKNTEMACCYFCGGEYILRTPSKAKRHPRINLKCFDKMYVFTGHNCVMKNAHVCPDCQKRVEKWFKSEKEQKNEQDDK